MPTAPPRPRRTSTGPDTTGTPDTPPRRRAEGSGTKDQGAGASPRRQPPGNAKLQRSLEELFTAPALIYSATGDVWAAEFVTQRGPVLAEAWAKLAAESPAVRRVLERMTTGTAWGGVIAATSMTVVPLVAHHGLLPAQIAAFVPGGNGQQANGGPIVPPPPAPAGPPPGAPGVSPSTPERSSGAGRDDYTPPVGSGPPGVVTVAGTTNGAGLHPPA